MPLFKFCSRNPGRAKDLGHFARIQRPEGRFPAFPSHLNAVTMMNKIIEIKPNLVAFDAHHITHLLGEARLPVGREAHHLVFVAILRKTEQLRECRIKLSERMWKLNRSEDLNMIITAHAPHNATEIAKSVDRQYGGLLERGGEKGAGKVGPMVFNEVNTYAIRIRNS